MHVWTDVRLTCIRQVEDQHHALPSESLSHASLMSAQSHRRGVSAPSLHDVLAEHAHRIPRTSLPFNPSKSTIPASLSSGATLNKTRQSLSVSESIHGPQPIEGHDASSSHAPRVPIKSSLDTPIICMYIENCDTGSPTRKAISHIFGRNKACTRMIPDFVWVHYCRKHYQRTRYRNHQEYAKLQSDLVQRQLERLHEWSEENRHKGQGAVIIDWTLAPRKREQKRLDGLKNRKRPANAAADREESGSEPDVEDAPQRRATPSTAAPGWLVARFGTSYKIDELMDIFYRLQADIVNENIPMFPDIEMLPRILMDGEEPSSPRGYARRKEYAGGHKKTQSASSMSMSSMQHPSEHQSGHSTSDDSSPRMENEEPAQKRRRQGLPIDEGYGGFSMPLAQRPHKPSASINLSINRRLSTSPAHRPVFADIQEHHTEDKDVYGKSGNSRSITQSPKRSYDPTPCGSTITAPSPQRPSSCLAVVPFEDGVPPPHYGASSRPHPGQPRMTGRPDFSPCGTYIGGRARHVRHQSTPLLVHQYQTTAPLQSNGYPTASSIFDGLGPHIYRDFATGRQAGKGSSSLRPGHARSSSFTLADPGGDMAKY